MISKSYTLDELCIFIRNGKSVKQSKDVDGLPITRIETIANQTIDSDRVGYAGLTEEEGKSHLLECGDILFSHINSLEHLCKTAIYTGFPEKLVHGMNLLCIRPNLQLIFPQYLLHLLRSSRIRTSLLQFANKSVNQASISAGNLKSFVVNIPPLAEQRRIATILDQADELRQKRQQAIEKLDQLLQATFIDMFGDPVSNPKGWEKVKFEDEVEFLTGFAFKSADFKDSGIKLCRGINILPNTLDWNDTAYWNEKELEKYSRFKILQNDILVAMDRPWISTGFKITLVKENDPNMLLVQRVARLRVKESFGANFLFQILSMPEFKKHCRITETTVPHISPTDFKSFDLIKPANHMIEKFEKIAKLINIQKDKMRDSEVQNDNLFASLQNRAFNGTL